MTKVCEIPALPMEVSSNFRLKLFNLNNQLHFINNTILFKLENNKPIYVQKHQHCGNYYASFCDITVCFNPKDKMTRINPDYTETELCKLEEDVSRFSFGQGGVVIFGSSNDDKFMVYDLLN